jgi:ubiquinone/menaquinone biosynthesis C-methylase UbiE
MTAAIDSLTSATLKHLRERWWDDEFTEFLAETLKPRAGNRILDVGCGEGLAEVAIGRLHISQIRLYGVDLVVSKVAAARRETASHNQRVGFAAADACHLPFADSVFDSIYCVAVLQHIRDVDAAVREMARVTRRDGRVVAVEPDNSARYGYSSVPAGMQAFAMAARLFAAVAAARGDGTDPAVGPKLPGLFTRHGIEPIAVRVFPVSQARLGPPGDRLWHERRAAVERSIEHASAEVRALGREYLAILAEYETQARQAGSSFVEIQNTLLFATVGQRV